MIDSKLIFSLKKDPVLAFKTRIVAKGFQQKQVEDTYSPVIDIPSIRLLLNMIRAMGGHVHQMDVKTAFLNGRLGASEVIYMRSPKEFDFGMQKEECLRLLKVTDGLKKSSKIWTRRWNDVMRKLKYTQLKSDKCMFSAVPQARIFCGLSAMVMIYYYSY